MQFKLVHTFNKVLRVLFVTISFLVFCLRNNRYHLFIYFFKSILANVHRYLGETKSVYLFLWPTSDYTKFNFDQTNLELLNVIKNKDWFNNTSIHQLIALTMIKRISVNSSIDLLSEFSDKKEYNIVRLDYDLLRYGWCLEFKNEERIGSFIFNKIPVPTFSNEIFQNHLELRKNIRKIFLQEIKKASCPNIIFFYLILFSLKTQQRSPAIFAINQIKKRMIVPPCLERLEQILLQKNVSEFVETKSIDFFPDKSFQAEIIEAKITFFTKEETFEFNSNLQLPSRNLYLENNITIAGTSANHLFVKSSSTASTMPFPDNQLIFSRNRVLATKNRSYWAVPSTPDVIIDEGVILPGISKNYFHFLFDTLGPVAMLNGHKMPSNVLIGGTKHLLPFQKEILDILNIRFEKYICSDDFAGRYLVQKGYFSDNPSYLNVICPRMIDFLRDKMIPSSNILPNKKIYFTRIDYQRSFKDKEYFQFCDYLRNNGFEIIDSGRLKVKDQIAIVQSAELLIVDAGAAAANLVFLNKNSKCILFASDFGYRETFSPIVQRVGFKHSVVLFKTKTVFPHAFHLWSDLIPEFDFNLAKKAVEANL